LPKKHKPGAKQGSTKYNPRGNKGPMDCEMIAKVIRIDLKCSKWGQATTRERTNEMEPPTKDLGTSKNTDKTKPR